ncbi:50S ribosomal protein L9 [Mycoplasmopsis columbinasalis]|uniref:Large ribosomal subunit protein bL9 n=1 Tax=Mycoplasmopsis columbinasalis TaxID=114880 RepID=A0A449BA61_9BACT|nr:50S ribosomal protein L9 [Mycoplasmopsis columbinasalis]VEU78082.1 50S ribosomal protein L9 [Mycoplasmopsis columbinasalis]
MKVILIKDCKDGKANTIIEVANGYGANYLIPQGFGVPYNAKTARDLEKRLSNFVADEMAARAQANELKAKLEQETFEYVLDAKIDANGNLNVHNAVSTKEIVKELTARGYKLDKHAVQKVHLVSNGTHLIDVIVYKDIVAQVKVVITINAR